MADRGPTGTSSLWLVPSQNSSLYKAIHTLITDSIPSVFPTANAPLFTPHITLTANTISSESSSSEFQQWLDNIALPSINDIEITINAIEIGEIFFQKLIMLCDKSWQLCTLAAACRSAGTGHSLERSREWIGENYRPHCSLM